jgi:hypothetical protein
VTLSNIHNSNPQLMGLLVALIERAQRHYPGSVEDNNVNMMINFRNAVERSEWLALARTEVEAQNVPSLSMLPPRVTVGPGFHAFVDGIMLSRAGRAVEALIYLSLACRQEPKNKLYAAELATVAAAMASDRRPIRATLREQPANQALQAMIQHRPRAAAKKTSPPPPPPLPAQGVHVSAAER